MPGSHGSLSVNKAAGEEGAKADITVMYSPLEAIEKAKANPDITYVVAAVGFETTAPTYALLVKEAARPQKVTVRAVESTRTVYPSSRVKVNVAISFQNNDDDDAGNHRRDEDAEKEDPA